MGTQPDELRTDVETTRAQLAQNVDRLADRVAPGRVARRKTDAAQRRLTGIKERVMGSAHSTGHDTKHAVSRTTDQIGGTAKDAAGRVTQTAQDTPDAVKRRTQGSPLAAGLIAFGAGMLAAAVLPATEAEERVGEQLRDHSDQLVQPVKETAQQTARELKEGMREPVQEHVGAVREHAQEAAGTTKEHAGSAGQDTTARLKEMGQDAAHDVRGGSGSR
ncbi:DUF3618 domain-containing protein [Streptomyces sp. NPDC060194]|uniref:DUF3618 domain-containing protein n=1 Tax=Streptomyces sp. NPDC060194 TaxID=3347069 RepID=UPI00364863FA